MSNEKYKRFGLRLDKNLSDLSDQEEALANVLNDLAENFQPIDIQPIRGLKNTNVDINDFEELQGNVEKVTVFSENTLSEKVLQPIVTLKDKIDNFKVITQDPPYLRGGTGPNAYLIPSLNLTDQSLINSQSNGSDIVSINGVGTIGPIEFWDNGNFKLASKIAPEFLNTYGGIQWIGFISSQITGVEIESTGFFLLEEDTLNDDNWTVLKSFYTDNYNITITHSSENEYDVISGIQNVTAKSLISYNGSDYRILSVDNNLSKIVVENLSLPLTGESVLVKSPIKSELYSSGVIPITEFSAVDQNRLRITMWWPENETEPLEDKRFTFKDQSSSFIEFTDFFKKKSTVQLPGRKSYEYFKRFKASEFQQSTDKSFRINNTLRGQYTVPQTRDEKIAPFLTTFVYNGNGRIAQTDNVNSLLIEVGDWLVFKKDDGTWVSEQIFEVVNDTTFFYQYLQDDGTELDIVPVDTEIEAAIVKNLGLVGIYVLDTTSSDLNYTKISGRDIQINNLLATLDYNDQSTPNSIFDVTSVSRSNSRITVEPLYSNETPIAFPSSTSIIGAVYSDAGLENLTTANNCDGTSSTEVTSLAPANQNQITVSDTSKITLDPKIYVQYKSTAPNFLVYESSVINDGVYITAINGNTITLSENLNEDILETSTLTLIQDAHWVSGVNKEFCVFPLNTAPPFEGTEDGLKTPDEYPNLDVQEFQFNEIEAPNLVTNQITEGLTQTYSQTLSIEDSNGKSYSLLFQ